MPVTAAAYSAQGRGAWGAAQTGHCPTRGGPYHHWQEGEIAFLQPASAFSDKDYADLITPKPGHRLGQIPSKATGHPVIILKRLSAASAHVLVTPVSAYSSGPDNNFLPPWRQHYHRRKDPNDFRSFLGCERYSTDRPSLYLADGRSMPKPRASWLNIQSAFVVPLNVISTFTKSRHLLRVQQESLDELRSHMAAKCHQWNEATRLLVHHEPRSADRHSGTNKHHPPAQTSGQPPSLSTSASVNHAEKYVPPAKRCWRRPSSSSSDWSAADGIPPGRQDQTRRQLTFNTVLGTTAAANAKTSDRPIPAVATVGNIAHGKTYANACNSGRKG